MRLAVVTTSVSSSNNNIPFAIGRPIYSRISSERGGIRRLSAEVIFGLVSIRQGENVMPTETSHLISFVMKRLVELRMTNGRDTRLSAKKKKSRSVGVISQEKNKQLGVLLLRGFVVVFLDYWSYSAKGNLGQGWASWNIKGGKENLTPVRGQCNLTAKKECFFFIEKWK